MRKAKPEIKPTRGVRRVLLMLLTGADNIGGTTIMDAAGLSSGTVYPVLGRLSQLGWIGHVKEAAPYKDLPPRRFYSLTPFGRTGAISLLKLEMPE